jgi:hypothetical protein
MLGQKVIDKRNIAPNLNAYALDVNSLSSGIYIIKIYQSGIDFNKKFLKTD